MTENGVLAETGTGGYRMGRLEFIVREGRWVTADDVRAERSRFGSMFEFREHDPDAVRAARRAPLDRFLTWSSYYVLVYVSACIFLPAQTAQAFEVMGTTLARTAGLPVERLPESFLLPSALPAQRQFEIGDWLLRGSSDEI
ncbi:MAG: hypothetical protein KDJ48_08570 [Nitratireductor sp.]|nr:hypothetical protein [Nitratireductor sp.]MCB1459299.1 hypothetical protein [Nitratireductor sp.]